MGIMRSSSKLTMVCVLAITALVAAVSTWSLTASLTAQEPSIPPSRRQADELSAAFRYAAKEVLPSVVTIQKIAAPVRRDEARPRRPRENPFEGTPFEDFFRDDPNLRRFLEEGPSTPRRGLTGMGTGVIIDPSGIVLTNNHVVEGDGDIRVRLGDGREFTATKVAKDLRTDVAVLWIENGGSLKAASLGDSDKMEIGDWVLAVGNPLGLYESVTAGIISAKGRVGLGVSMSEGFLQTDAAINPGNSGGPLVNLDGEVIGINIAIASRTGGYQGYGFAIPVNVAKWVAGQLIEHGEVQRAYLGTEIKEVSQEIATRFGIDVRSGALIWSVLAESPAEQAGLKPGDVVQQFGETKITGPHDLTRAVEKTKVGSSQRVRILRDGKPMSLDVTVRLMSKDYGMARRGIRREPREREQAAGELGVEVEPLTDEVARGLNMREGEGVVITFVESNSLAATAGLTEGMVIMQVNRKPVRSIEDFRAALKERSPDRKSIFLLVRTERGSRFIEIRNNR